MAAFKRKMDRIQAVAWNVIKPVYEEQGERYERILVPIVDGKRGYNIPCNLKDAYESEAKDVIKHSVHYGVIRLIGEDFLSSNRQLYSTLLHVQTA